MAFHIIALTEKDVFRFMGRLKRNTVTGCLEFMAARSSRGYGWFKVGGRPELSHRVAFVIGGGVLSEEKPYVLHNCPSGDNPACCEFTHLWAGTQLDNVMDMAKKCRGTKSRRGLPCGVTLHRSGGFNARAVIDKSGRRIHLGTFSTAREAGMVAGEAKEKYLNSIKA